MELKEFLQQKANKYIEECTYKGGVYTIYPRIVYCEDVESDYMESWGMGGEVECSYIYKVGVLSVSDGNKCDFAKLFIAAEVEEGKFDYFGELFFSEGENTDLERTLPRIGKCLIGCWN